MGNLWDDLSSKALSIREKKKPAIIYNTINICMWNMMLQCLITTQKTAIRIQHYIHVGKFVDCFQSNYYLHIFLNLNTNCASSWYFDMIMISLDGFLDADVTDFFYGL